MCAKMSQLAFGMLLQVDVLSLEYVLRSLYAYISGKFTLSSGECRFSNSACITSGTSYLTLRTWYVVSDPSTRVSFQLLCQLLSFILFASEQLSPEYDNMDLEMLQEVVPMLKQQLEKSMLDRNYVQLERVRGQWALLSQRKIGRLGLLTLWFQSR